MQTIQDSVNRLRTMANTEPLDRDICLRAVNYQPYLSWLHRDKCRRRAMVRPLPGNLLGAFMDKSIKVGTRDVCRVVPAHLFILQKIESKLLDMLSAAESNGKGDADLDAQERWDVCWIFTNAPEMVFNLVRDGGPDALRKESSKIGLDWDAAEIDPVLMAVFEQFKRHAENKVKLLSDLKKEGSITFFQEPEPTPAKKQPATAGS